MVGIFDIKSEPGIDASEPERRTEPLTAARGINPLLKWGVLQVTASERNHTAHYMLFAASDAQTDTQPISIDDRTHSTQHKVLE